MSAILSGVKVLDLSRVLAGPYCAQTLADLGAEVTKVEAPWGDDTRHWGPPFTTGFDGEQVAAYWLSVNRKKNIITANLKDEEDRIKVKQLMSQADVIIENFKPGTLERLLGPLPDSAIIASINAYGDSGPRRDEGGYDLAIQARSGLMSITGDSDGPPAKAGVAIIDVACGLHAVNGILAALFHKQKTGEVKNVQVSLWETGIDLLVNQVHNVLTSGNDPHRMGSAHPNLVPYRAFEANDGWFVIAVGSDNQWKIVAEKLALEVKPQWAENAGRIEDREALEQALSIACSKYSRSELEQMLEGVPTSPVNTISEALNDPQSIARGVIEEWQGVRVIRPPVRLE